MKTFEHFNQSGNSLCPICKTNEDKEIILVPIYGTSDGNISEAIQVHTKCIENQILYYPEQEIIVINCKSY